MLTRKKKSKRKRKPTALEAQGLTHREPDYETRGGVHTPGGVMLVWPEGKPTPTRYYRRDVYPCEECRRVYSDTLTQAVLTEQIRDGTAYLRCRCCGHRFALPVRERTG